jgi:hypothetical protein
MKSRLQPTRQTRHTESEIERLPADWRPDWDLVIGCTPKFTSDPNRPEEAGSILNLVHRIIWLSLEA